MASWAALNAESAPRAALEEARDGATQEAQDAHNALLYGRALRLQQKQKVEEARAIYTELLETSPGLSPRLRYLCAKNLATLEAERGAFPQALQRYAEALALDDTDVVVWYQMGKTALETGQLWLARQAFESGFHLDATFWPLPHALCDVLHALNDGAAYQRVAEYLLEKDSSAGRVGGPLQAMDSTIDPEFRVCPSQSTQTESTLKRRTPALDALGSATKKRKAMADACREHEQVAVSRAPLKYLLQQSSWLTLGKLLLEAYDDVSNEHDQNSAVFTRRVFVSADFVDEPSASEPSIVDTISTGASAAPNAADKPVDGKTAVVDLSVDENVEKAGDGTCVEPIEVDEGDDGDQDDGGASVVQTNRRKSRRHQEKLREEHALAAKLAREKNLAYRLQAYVPEVISGDNDSVYREIVFRVDGDAVILEYSNGDFVHKFENVLPSAPVDESADAEDMTKEGDGASTSNASKTVDGEQISKFVASLMASTDGVDIVRLLQAYLNQCGAWADQALVPITEDQDQTLHSVCLWAEKVVRGRLDVATPTTPGQATDKQVRSRVSMSRHPQDGLTIEARLFLLELHLDNAMYHKAQQGQVRSRKVMRSYFAQLDEIVRDAQELLLDICWSTNDDGIGSGDETKKSSQLLGRLFWLSGIASEQRGNTAAAKEYFAKCKLSLDELDQAPLVSLPNLRSETTLSLASLEQKITGMDISNVCNEVQEMATTSRFDEAQGKLLSHFFPANGQASRINELLEDFAKQREQDHGDSAGDVNASENNVLELLLESVENSASSKCSDKILILLVVLSKLLEAVIENLEKVSSQPKKADAERHTLSIAVQAIELTVDKLASVIVGQSDSESDSPSAQICSHTKQAAMAVVTVLLKPKILLLFDSPRDVLQVIHEMTDQLASMPADITVASSEIDASKEVFAPLVIAAATSFRTIRSLSFSDRQRMLTVLTATTANARSKKKQSVRHDRVRAYVQTVVGLLAGHVQLLVALSPANQVKGLMEDCCPLLKEEEEMTRRHHDGDKAAKKTLVVGSLLFLQLVEAVLPKYLDKAPSLKILVGLVRLLHERLGEYELCSLDCFDKAIGIGNCVGKTFVQVAASYLQDRYKDHNAIELAKRRHKSRTPEIKQSNESADTHSDFEESGDEGNGAEDGDEEAGYEHTLAQCYRCLYDTHILPGCLDHKTGTSIADLDSASPKTVHHVARLAIPIMLRRPPRSNAQKKDNLKILFAIQRSIDSMEDASQPPAASPPQLLLEYLSPQSLLSWKGEVPMAVLKLQPSARVDSCLEDLWFLLGENFILHRVRKRSNLSELIEMERKIKERIAYLLKDVQHYRPRRIKSWARLGRSTKELYEVASDACALILGRKWRKRHLLATNSASDGDGGGGDVQEPPSFEHVVLSSSLFEKMKIWHELDDASKKSSYRVCFEKAPIVASIVEAEPLPPATEFSMEATANHYLEQVVEFSRRCFTMAAALATHPGQRQDDDKATDEDSTGVSSRTESDEDVAELMQTAVDMYEDCGLLLYNQLREFSVLRHDDEIASSGAFPTSLYCQILGYAFQCFQDGLDLSAKSDSDAHDVRFRLHYMIGKVLKKRLQIQQRPPHGNGGSDSSSPAVRATTPGDVMKCFANAEEEHEKGNMDKSIVHAFYQLQATRLLLVLDEPITGDNLRLACDHFFEEASDEESEDEDEDMKKEDEKDGEEGSDTKVGTEDVAALLKAAAEDHEAADSTDLLHLAQGWLFVNVVDALESISDEDRYFHASRYTLAKAMYRYSDIVERLSAIRDDLPLSPPSTSAKNCIAALADRKTKKKNDGKSPAEIALKEMYPLFDKRRPQVVAIWLSEHVPASKKFEELNQRQLKFDFCRLKYVSYFVRLLQENEAYARLKEIGSWVLACKEEHDAIDEMLGLVLHARGAVQLSRLREYVCTELVDQLERHQKTKIEALSFANESAAVADADHQDDTKEAHDSESVSESLLKELSKAYVNYLDVAHASGRLAAVVPGPVLQELVALAEFPIVCLCLIGTTEFPKTFDVLNRDGVLTATSIATLTLKLRAVLLNDPSPHAVTACTSADWQPLLHAARSFCEDRWPERQSGKQASAGKSARKARPVKAAASASAAAHASAPPATMEAVGTSADAQPVPTGTAETPVGGTDAIASAELQPSEI